jgi:hypothetical protein
MTWPQSASLDDLQTCGTCGIRVYADTPGSLQVLTRRQGNGAGDGVNIEENVSIGADYRGQRYTFEEAVFHVPGLHIFPGNKEVYPAEYHIHMQTFSKPQRTLTLVLPVTHRDLASTAPGQDYFAAVAARPDPAATRPALGTLFVPGASMLQYQGPDIRGRTGANPVTAACDPDVGLERQFLLVLGAPLRIRATDLERIPREGSLSTDARDLPARPGVSPKSVLPRDRLRRCVVLASPGILGPTAAPLSDTPTPSTTMELECKPLQVVDGTDVVIDLSGQPTSVAKSFGLKSGRGLLSAGVGAGAGCPIPDASVAAATTQVNLVTQIVASLAALFGTALGFVIMNWIYRQLWKPFFLDTPRLNDDPLLQMKVIVGMFVVFGAAIAPFLTSNAGN